MIQKNTYIYKYNKYIAKSKKYGMIGGNADIDFNDVNGKYILSPIIHRQESDIVLSNEQINFILFWGNITAIPSISLLSRIK